MTLNGAAIAMVTASAAGHLLPAIIPPPHVRAVAALERRSIDVLTEQTSAVLAKAQTRLTALSQQRRLA